MMAFVSADNNQEDFRTSTKRLEHVLALCELTRYIPFQKSLLNRMDPLEDLRVYNISSGKCFGTLLHGQKGLYFVENDGRTHQLYLRNLKSAIGEPNDVYGLFTIAEASYDRDSATFYVWNVHTIKGTDVSKLEWRESLQLFEEEWLQHIRFSNQDSFTIKISIIKNAELEMITSNTISSPILMIILRKDCHRPDTTAYIWNHRNLTEGVVLKIIKTKKETKGERYQIAHWVNFGCGFFIMEHVKITQSSIDQCDVLPELDDRDCNFLMRYISYARWEIIKQVNETMDSFQTIRMHMLQSKSSVSSSDITLWLSKTLLSDELKLQNCQETPEITEEIVKGMNVEEEEEENQQLHHTFYTADPEEIEKETYETTEDRAISYGEYTYKEDDVEWI